MSSKKTGHKPAKCVTCEGELSEGDESTECVRCRGDHFINTREDTLIRRAGFTIHARPRRGEAIWERLGIFYPHNEALAEAERLYGIISYMRA